MTEKATLLEKTISLAKKLGYTEIIAEYETGENWQIRFSNSQQDIFKRWDLDSIELFLVMDQKTTEIEIESPSLDKIQQKLTEAKKFMKTAPPSQMYKGIESEIKPFSQIENLFDSRTTSFYEKAPGFVNDAIHNAEEAGAKKVAGVLYFGTGNTLLHTSHGFSGDFDSSYYRMTIRSFVDAESSGQHVLCGRNLDNIDRKIRNAGSQSGLIANRAVNPKQGKAGTYDVILSPTVAGNVFGQITDTANPLMIMLGMSPLTDKLHEQLGPDSLTIHDHSLIGEGLHSRPFDFEGTPTQNLPIFQNGELVNLIHNTSTAQMSNTKSTGNSTLVGFGAGSKILAPYATNMVYTPGDFSHQEIIEEAKKPTIYITSNWYTRFTNQLEGTFSTIPRDGLFYVENGEIQYPIRNVRLSDNLLRMLKNISQIGNNIQQIQWWEVETPTFIPTIKVDDCNITAATQ